MCVSLSHPIVSFPVYNVGKGDHQASGLFLSLSISFVKLLDPISDSQLFDIHSCFIFIVSSIFATSANWRYWAIVDLRANIIEHLMKFRQAAQADRTDDAEWYPLAFLIHSFFLSFFLSISHLCV